MIDGLKIREQLFLFFEVDDVQEILELSLRNGGE